MLFNITADYNKQTAHLELKTLYAVYILNVWFEGASWRCAFHPSGGNGWIANKQIQFHDVIARAIETMVDNATEQEV